MASPIGTGVKNIQSLPENIILEILSYLPLKDLCRVCRVCRTWRRIANDNKLWRHVDMRPYRLDLKRLWKIIRSHFSEVLLTLQISGFLTPNSINWNKSSISDAMLKDLRDRCPNLKHLALHKTNLCKVDGKLLPPTLTRLDLVSSMTDPDWFETVQLEHLEHLNLAGCSKINNTDVKRLSNWEKLRHLDLSGCYRLTRGGLLHVADSLTELTHLDLSQTGCTDLVLHSLGRNCKSIEVLNLKECSKISDSGLLSVLSGLKLLQELRLCGCKQITDGCLASVSGLKKLCLLDVSRTAISVDSVELMCLKQKITVLTDKQ